MTLYWDKISELCVIVVCVCMTWQQSLTSFIHSSFHISSINPVGIGPDGSAHLVYPLSDPGLLRVHLSLPSLAFTALTHSLSLSVSTDETKKVGMNRMNMGVLGVLGGLEGLLLLSCIRHGWRWAVRCTTSYPEPKKSNSLSAWSLWPPNNVYAFILIQKYSVHFECNLSRFGWNQYTQEV